jgi:hypothetical protein
MKRSNFSEVAPADCYLSTVSKHIWYLGCVHFYDQSLKLEEKHVYSGDSEKTSVTRIHDLDNWESDFEYHPRQMQWVPSPHRAGRRDRQYPVTPLIRLG